MLPFLFGNIFCSLNLGKKSNREPGIVNRIESYGELGESLESVM